MRCPESCVCDCFSCGDGDCCRVRQLRFRDQTFDDFDEDELGLDPEEEYDA